MKYLITDTFHWKNREALIIMFNLHNIEFRFGKEIDIPNYDIIYSPNNPIDTSKYPDKKFIFGPHFSVFPTGKLIEINNIYNNSVYIQPSEWALNAWKPHMEHIVPIKTYCFPVNVNKFKCTDKFRDKVFVYYKRRKPEELKYIVQFLESQNIEFKVFDYIKKYIEKDYISYLQECKYGIIIDAHESQGFALEEAMSCNVPLLVWNVKFMSQEYNSRYPDIPASSVPYFDERCGTIFYEQNEFLETFTEFINNINNYNPREYILENLSYDKCCKNFTELI